jgi:hypothetical protein
MFWLEPTRLMNKAVDETSLDLPDCNLRIA